MFNLETAIDTWRHALKNNHTLSQEDLDELEQHLRDQIPWLIHDGLTEEAAFRTAIREMGEIPTIQQAYSDVFWKKAAHKHTLRSELAMRLQMLASHLKIGFRTLAKQKIYSGINILGLMVGLTAFLLIGLFIRYELSYDRFHPDSERLYRVVKQDPENFYLSNDTFALTPVPLVAALPTEVPGVEYATQVSPLSALLSTETASFFKDGLFASADFFQVFGFELGSGTPQSALTESGSIVLTKELAAQLFGESDVLGRRLRLMLYGEEVELTVTGVMPPPPATSHLRFDYLISINTDHFWVEDLTGWDNNDWYTYFKASPEAKASDLDTRIRQLGIEKLGVLEWNVERPERTPQYFIQSVPSIHLYSKTNFEISENGDITYVWVYGAIAFFILLIACVNYMNLATARSMTRAREIGIRKSSGASRSQLVNQFLGESFFVTCCAAIGSVMVNWLLLPRFGALIERAIPREMLFEPASLGLILATVVVVAFVAGSYPAFLMSGFNPTRMLVGKTFADKRSAVLRNALVVVQYTIGIVLIASTIIVDRQLSFLSSVETGIDRDQIVIIPQRDPSLRGSYSAIQSELENIPSVVSASNSFSLPTDIAPQSSTSRFEGNDDSRSIPAYNTGIGYGWIELLGLEMVEGRSFSTDFTADEGAGLIINEAAMRAAGWETAMGKNLDYGWRGSTVVGVVKDFNFHSFRQQIEPLILYLNPERPRYVLVKVATENMTETLSQMEAAFAKFSPDFPVEFQFLDEAYEALYRKDQKLGGLFRMFSLMAIIIACLGLFALSAFMVERRRNEIGVRKALGADAKDIILQMNKEFLQLIVLSIAVATPTAWFLMNTWLDDFAYKADIGFLALALPGVLALVVAVLTVGYQSIKAARMNPVEALRHI